MALTGGPVSRFIALVEKENDSFGVFFPQLPGCVSMGESLDGAIGSAADALAEWVGDEAAAGRVHEPEDLATTTAREEVAIAIGQGAVPVFVPLVSESGRSVRVNLSLDAGLLTAIDEAARRRGMTRSSWIASAARVVMTQGS